MFKKWYLWSVLCFSALQIFCSQNEYNTDFYEALGAETLKEFAVKSGLDSGEDVKRLYPYIKNAKVILEIGAGYGRAASFIEKGMSEFATLYLCENVPSFVKELETVFSDPIFVLNKDFRELDEKAFLKEKPDLILWMWSGLFDFAYEEQEEAFKTLKKLLAPHGHLVVDLPCHSSVTNSTHVVNSSIEGEEINIRNGDIVYIGFFLSLERMKKLIEKAGFKLDKIETYKPPNTDRERAQYFLVIENE